MNKPDIERAIEDVLALKSSFFRATGSTTGGDTTLALLRAERDRKPREMTYKLPEPKGMVWSDDYDKDMGTDLYTAEQMQQAYIAGREAMRGECLAAYEKWMLTPLDTVADTIRSIK